MHKRNKQGMPGLREFNAQCVVFWYLDHDTRLSLDMQFGILPKWTHMQRMFRQQLVLWQCAKPMPHQHQVGCAFV